MALRSFFALDSSSMVVSSSSNGAIVGNSIINNSDTPNGTVFTYSSGTGATVTLNDTGGGSNVFNDDNAANHVITDGNGLVANGNQVESESHIIVRALDSGGNPTGPEITLYIFSQNGTTSDVWGYAATAPLSNGTSYVKTGGSNSGSSSYSNYMTCFGDGTLIKTPDGHVAVQDLTVGQQVWTKDNGPQPVRWVATTKVAATGAFAPVVFAPHSIGNSHQLVVSQQHRILIKTPMAEVLFGCGEVFVAAKHLCGLAGVAIHEQDSINYTHFMFDRHQIVKSDGALTESFYLGSGSVSALDHKQRDELLTLFPSLMCGDTQFGPTAAMTLKSQEAALLRSYIQ